MSLASISSDPSHIGMSDIFDDEVPSHGITLEIYYQTGSAPEILSITQGRGKDRNDHSETIEKLEKRLMDIKNMPGSRKRKTRKIKRKH
jgi:hypothetical protein